MKISQGQILQYDILLAKDWDTRQIAMRFAGLFRRFRNRCHDGVLI